MLQTCTPSFWLAIQMIPFNAVTGTLNAVCLMVTMLIIGIAYRKYTEWSAARNTKPVHYNVRDNK